VVNRCGLTIDGLVVSGGGPVVGGGPAVGPEVGVFVGEPVVLPGVGDRVVLGLGDALSEGDGLGDVESVGDGDALGTGIAPT
jgi:hypothetical protein